MLNGLNIKLSNEARYLEEQNSKLAYWATAIVYITKDPSWNLRDNDNRGWAHLRFMIHNILQSYFMRWVGTDNLPNFIDSVV